MNINERSWFFIYPYRGQVERFSSGINEPSDVTVRRFLHQLLGGICLYLGEWEIPLHPLLGVRYGFSLSAVGRNLSRGICFSICYWESVPSGVMYTFVIWLLCMCCMWLMHDFIYCIIIIIVFLMHKFYDESIYYHFILNYWYLYMFHRYWRLFLWFFKDSYQHVWLLICFYLIFIFRIIHYLIIDLRLGWKKLIITCGCTKKMWYCFLLIKYLLL